MHAGHRHEMRAFRIAGIVALEISVEANPMHLATALHLLFTDNRNVVFRLAGDGAAIAANAVIQIDRHAPGVVQTIPLILIIVELGMVKRVVLRRFFRLELVRANSGTVFSSVFAYYPTRKGNVMVKGQAEQAGGEFVSGDYFHGLQVSPAAGRLILPDDDRVGAAPIAVVSFAFSQRRFGDAASALGQSILNMEQA